jgi:hypothetical protein
LACGEPRDGAGPSPAEIRVVQKLQFLNNNRLKTARNVNF